MSGDPILLAIFAGVFLAFLCVVIAFGDGVGRRRRKRIEAIRARAVLHSAESEGAAPTLVADDRGGSGLEQVLAGLLPRRAQLRLRLQRAGLGLSVGRYAAASLGVAIVAAAAFRLVLGAPYLLAGLAALAVGVMGPHLVLNTMIARREKRFLQLFPEAIDLMVRGLKSGLPISESVVNVGEEMPDPVGFEFRQIANAVRLGATLDEALWDAARRIGLAEFRFFTISLAVQRETGGNLGETLGNLADILRKRLTMKLKVKAMSSEARASAYIIGSLPFVMFGVLMLTNPEYVTVLLSDPRGIVMIGIGLVTMSIGVAIMFKMVRFEI